MRKPMRKDADLILTEPGELYKYTPVNNLSNNRRSKDKKDDDPL